MFEWDNFVSEINGIAECWFLQQKSGAFVRNLRNFCKCKKDNFLEQINLFFLNILNPYKNSRNLKTVSINALANCFEIRWWAIIDLFEIFQDFDKLGDNNQETKNIVFRSIPMFVLTVIITCIARRVKS